MTAPNLPTFFEFTILALACFRLTRMVTTDTLFSPIREAIWRRFPPESRRFGYLFTCDWCSSVWIASLLLGVYMIIPVPTLVFSLLLSLSAVTGIISTRLDE